MSLQKKMMLISFITVFFLISLLYFSSNFILMSSFISIEKRDTIKHTQIALASLNHEIKNLDVTVSDYAAWDDSYRFIQDGNHEFINANLLEATFTSLKVNLILFVRYPNFTVFAKALNLNTGKEIPFPKGLETHLEANSPLLQKFDTQSYASGILKTPEGILLISSHPIQTSERKGPVNGVVIMGRYLDTNVIRQLSDITQLSLTIQSINFSAMPHDFQKAFLKFSKESPIVIDEINPVNISGYGLVSDIYQKPCIMIRMDTPRDIYQQGKDTIRYFVISLLIIGLVLGIIMIFLIKRVVLKRLARLDKEMKTIRTGKDLSVRVSVTGKDELSYFSETINEMLSALEQSQIEIETHRNHLEVLVKNRTEELTASNQNLREEINERQRLEEELRKAKEVAESANHAKTVFLANMSHELRTPLNIILGYARILKKYPTFSQKEKEAVKAIHQSGEALLTMINDLLDITKIEKQEIILNPEEFHFFNWLKNIFDFHSMQAKEKGLSLDFHTDPELPVMVYGDEKRLRQILRNLIINAIKFTNQGNIVINVKCMSILNGKRVVVRFEIEDTGIGIPQDHLKKIFDAFHSIDSKKLYSDGIGIGLNLSQRLLSLMGGTLYVESTPNKGSLFWFEIELNYAKFNGDIKETDKTDSSQSTQPSEDLIVIPPIEELKTLYKFAQMGDVDSILCHIMTIKNQNSEFSLFADKINHLAENFMVEEIQEFLYPYLN